MNIHKRSHTLYILTIKFCFYLDGKLISSINLSPTSEAYRNIIGSIFITLFNQVILIPKSWPGAYIVLVAISLDLLKLGKSAIEVDNN